MITPTTTTKTIDLDLGAERELCGTRRARECGACGVTARSGPSLSLSLFAFSLIVCLPL
jgi:hypothetical protein